MRNALAYCNIPSGDKEGIPYAEILKDSLRTFEGYCVEHDLDLVCINSKKYAIEPCDHYNVLIYEKNQMYDLLQRYDRVFRVDIDMLIRGDCPDVFAMVPEDSIGVVFEDVGSRLENRRTRIREIQKYFGVNLDWSSGYFNAGMIVASRQHADAFLNDVEFLNTVACGPNAPKYVHNGFEDFLLTDQSILNYNVRRNGHKIHPMDYRFNHLKFFSERWNGKPVRTDSYIAHYAGYEDKVSVMKEDLDKFIGSWNMGQRVKIINER